MLNKLIAYANDRMAKRREYRRLLGEISSMSHRDLIEIGAFQADLYRGARHQVYGA